MSTHRYPCTAEPPEPDGLGTAPDGHIHACIHDGPADPNQLAEHECECGMTWRYRPLLWRIYNNIPAEGQFGNVPEPGLWSRFWAGIGRAFTWRRR